VSTVLEYLQEIVTKDGRPALQNYKQRHRSANNTEKQTPKANWQSYSLSSIAAAPERQPMKIQ
jgi:hypothetical protein